MSMDVHNIKQNNTGSIKIEDISQSLALNISKIWTKIYNIFKVTKILWTVTSIHNIQDSSNLNWLGYWECSYMKSTNVGHKIFIHT